MPASPQWTPDAASHMTRTTSQESQYHDSTSFASHPNMLASSTSSRKPTPSPLQTSETFSVKANGNNVNGFTNPKPFAVQYPSGGSHFSPQSPRSPLSIDRDQPKSPRERLDELVATEALGKEASTSTSPETGSMMGLPSAPNKAGSYNQLRNVSSPGPLPKSLGTSPPASPIRTASTPFAAGAIRPDLRSMPRTSSIDSAISTLSSATSHSHKSSMDSNTSTATEITHLINTAGSAEALIQHLLREKQHATKENAQLWKLVDKQRTLVLGLNQDLDRALKDKERYRKKLKEQSAHIPPVPDAGLHAAVRNSRAGSRSPADNSSDGTPLQRNRVRDTVILDPKPASKEKDEGSTKPDGMGSNTDTHVEAFAYGKADKGSPSRSGMATTRGTMDGKGDPGARRSDRRISPIQTNDLDQPKPHPGETFSDAPSVTQSIDAVVSPNSFTAKRSLPLAQRRPSAPSFQLTECTPPSSAHEKGQLPVRKLPPAPLNLRPSQKDVQYGPDDHSGSEYEDNVEVDELPALERGRRKTREEDDRDRETALIREQEDRSRSKKSKDSKPPVERATAAAAQLSMPPSIKGLSPEQPNGVENSNFLAAPTSLAGVLSPPESQSSTIRSKALYSLPLSPGLPVSPRPVDRPVKSPAPRMIRDDVGTYGASPPVSPRHGFVGLPLSPRAPRQPIPMPPHTPMSIVSPMVPSIESRKEPTADSSDSASPVDTQSEHRSLDATERSATATSIERPQSRGIFRGFMSEIYPDLLIPPNALPSISIRVNSSRLKPSRHSYLSHRGSEEDSVFTLGVSARSDNRQLWQVEKALTSLPHLDHQIRRTTFLDAKLPDRSLFSGHAPAKIDARRAGLDRYFESVLDTPMDEQAALTLCRYLSTQVMEPSSEENGSGSSTAHADPSSPIKQGSDGRLAKEGYLTKRGKNFGGWKARFFVLDEPTLRYYESPGGAILGTIKLQHAQIGKQSSQSSHSPSRTSDEGDGQYRHAFLIMEPKRKDSSSYVRHVLCAESDAERDAWVEALLHYVEARLTEDRARPQLLNVDTGSSKALKKQIAKKDGGQADSPDSATFEGLQAVSYDNTVPARPPVISITPQRVDADTPSPPFPDNNNASSGRVSQTSKAISGPSNGAKIEDAGAWGNKAPQPKDVKEPKKRGIWGFRERNLDVNAQAQADESRMSFIEPSSLEVNSNVRLMFGVPLAEAVEFCSPKGIDVFLPAVVYRCLEYLEAQDAASEEGIFRLSGSSVVIKALRDRFNTQGDFDFLADGEYYDVHAVASLLKLFLRELPSTVLTRELHLDFLAVLELDSKAKKIAAYNRLVHRLPKANWTLIRSLSAFLINIVNNSDVNKMSVRNVGIVFSPTLNIPAPVFAMFLTDFDAIFGEGQHQAPPGPAEVTVNEPLTPEDIRSPRRQMFSEIPTPSYTQSTFPPSSSYGQMSQPRQARDDTGFVPLQPSYEGQVVQGPENSGNNRGLAPDSAVKARRRESSMMLMGGNHRKSSVPLLRGDSNMFREEQAFT
ncbi:MAG: hypothetical protein Q9174_000833 [Haloplaca sp. 1 TL-2023]